MSDVAWETQHVTRSDDKCLRVCVYKSPDGDWHFEVLDTFNDDYEVDDLGNFASAEIAMKAAEDWLVVLEPVYSRFVEREGQGFDVWECWRDERIAAHDERQPGVEGTE